MVKKDFIYGIIAGILISIGGAVYLAVENKIAASVLFTVALLCICLREYNLYTGKIGFLVEAHKKENVSATFLALLGNLIGTYVCGLLVRFGVPKSGDIAEVLCNAKLGQSFVETLIRGVFCGILMYLAVVIYRENGKVIGILFCVPVFILSGFEHSIADLFYFSASGIYSLKATGFLWTVILGNSIGAMIIPALIKLSGKKAKTGAEEAK